MKQRGRKSSDAVAVIGSADGPVLGLQPPAELTDEQRQVWQKTVDGRPADYFGCEQAAVLVEYVCAVCRGRVIRQMLAEHERARDSAKSLNAWTKEFMALNQMADRSATLIQALARAMRLTHQAFYTAHKVIPKKGQTLWQRSAH